MRFDLRFSFFAGFFSSSLRADVVSVRAEDDDAAGRARSAFRALPDATARVRDMSVGLCCVLQSSQTLSLTPLAGCYRRWTTSTDRAGPFQVT